MARIAVYSEPVRRWYTAQACSVASFVQVVLWLMNVIIPLIISYSIPGFWHKFSEYREQPYLRYQHQLMVSLSSSTDQLATWSTMANYNRLASSKLRIPQVTSYSVDSNFDGKPDAFNITVVMPMASGESVRQVQLMLFFSCHLSTFSRLQAQGMAYVEQSSPFSGWRLDVGGDLVLTQRNPLPWTGVVTTSNTSIIDTGSVLAKDYNILNILHKYAERNETTRLRNTYSVWSRHASDQQPFTIQAYIRFPEQTFTYRAGFWELIKFAWVQYLSVFLVFIWLFDGIKRFIFSNGIILTSRKDS